jgi:hypothetical protein
MKLNKPAKIFRAGAKPIGVSPVDEDVEGHRMPPSSAKPLGVKPLGVKPLGAKPGDEHTEGHKHQI